jgi:L-fucose mutarotase/ribose pyranase (RbsD/FucU family)
MLIGISPLIFPELLALLHRMGHGGEIVLADAHFPGETYFCTDWRTISTIFTIAATATSGCSIMM